jgi:hypothetical protein
MSRRSIILLAASVITGLGSIATASTEAFAHRKAVHHHRVATAPPAPVVVGVIDNNYGPVADGIPRCFDSAILYPCPPCY